MASYNPQTDKIEGAEEGTLIYKHELGHREWYKMGLGDKFDLYFITFLTWTVFLAAFQFTLIAEISAVIMMFFAICPEVFAWFYAFFISKPKETNK